MLKRLLLLATFSLPTFTLYAQMQTYVGKVISAGDKQPVIGATIQLKDAATGTVTDFEGNFSVKAEKGKALIISFVGLQTTEITLGDQTRINAELTVDEKLLNEVVIQGFPSPVVNSRRRVEKLQEIPETVTAFTAKDLDNAGIRNMGQMMAYVPNMSVINSQNVGNTAITVRGLSQVRNGEAPVAVLVDGVTLASPNSILQDLYDVELVEVIKGPQGALYGRNAIGGAINMITRKPTNTPEYFARLGYGNGNSFQTSVGAGGKIITDKLFYRVAGSFQNRDGFIKNTTLDKFVDPLQNIAGRFQLNWQASNKLSIDVNASTSNTKGGAVYFVVMPKPAAPRPPYPNNNASDFNTAPASDRLGESERTLRDASVRARYQLGSAQLEVIGAYSFVDEAFSGDLDFTASSVLAQYQRLQTNAYMQEARLTSASDRSLRWTLGAFNMFTNRQLTTIGSIDLASPIAGLLGLPPGQGFFPFLDRATDDRNIATAVFGQLNYNITPKLEVSAALRFDNDSREQTNLKATSEAARVINTSFQQLQPKASLSYKFTPQVMMYANLANGFRSGGFNAPENNSRPATLYKAEASWNYELGYKSLFLNNRLIFNVAAFYINYSNQQIFLVDVSPAARGQLIFNVDRATTRGGEIELKARPVKMLDIFAAFALTDSRVEALTPTPELRAEFVGNQLPLVHRTKTNIGAQLTLPVVKEKGWELLLRGDWENRGPMYWHIDNNDKQAAYSLLNTRLALQNKKYFVALWANNLTDTQYNVEFVAQQFSGALFGDVRWPNQPRTFGVEMGVKF